eukprot:TRINITY_DN21722_c0_g1_i3.p1 TRINITY_DN21722_c0_g1~~TRINITY_DN21722_c0_g1_i3.p1  ORF type:complete len:188 (+),score=21.80 TRINITY_DN21722_c0_g1_i3:339-902(+)
MSKIPVPLLFLMLKLGDETVVAELRGAFPICMAPDERTAMNVIVGRSENRDGMYTLKKFSLYYPSNREAERKWGKNWPLVDGASFRTAIFHGGIDAARRALGSLEKRGAMTVDSASAYEDAIYFKFEGEISHAEKLQRIRSDVSSVTSNPRIRPSLAMSFDPASRDAFLVEEELQLLEQALQESATV